MIIEPHLSSSKDPIEAKCEADLGDAWDHCQKYTKSIEILYENNDNQKTLAKVHFRFNPKVSYTTFLKFQWLVNLYRMNCQRKLLKRLSIESNVILLKISSEIF